MESSIRILPAICTPCIISCRNRQPNTVAETDSSGNMTPACEADAYLTPKVNRSCVKNVPNTIRYMNSITIGAETLSNEGTYSPSASAITSATAKANINCMPVIRDTLVFLVK